MIVLFIFQFNRGTLTFSKKTNEQLKEKILKIQYIKKEEQENLTKNIENNNDLTEKLNNLKKKNLELDKILKDTDKKATNLKLIHEYNEIKVIFFRKYYNKFKKFNIFKDSCTVILGKLAEIQGKSAQEIFQEYNIKSSD